MNTFTMTWKDYDVSKINDTDLCVKLIAEFHDADWRKYSSDYCKFYNNVINRYDVLMREKVERPLKKMRIE